MNRETYKKGYVPEYSSVAAIIFTSAMDGYALGAVLTHQGIFHSAQSVAAMLPQTAGLFLTVLPLFHAFGLTSSLTVPILLKIPIALVDKFSPRKVLRYILRQEVQSLVAVPAMYSILKPFIERDINVEHILVWVSGGDYLPRKLQEWYMNKGINIRQGYGLTEASPIVSWNIPAIENRLGSVGKPMPYNEVKIVDKFGRDVCTGKDGEITVRGINVIEGYYNNKTKTNKYIKDGWLHTGDIGYFDEDGYIFISGRKKDMILRNGYNVYPKEVERFLYNHPEIVSARVSGHVRFTGESTEEKLVAYTRLKRGATTTIEMLRQWCVDNISLYKIPDEFFIT